MSINDTNKSLGIYNRSWFNYNLSSAFCMLVLLLFLYISHIYPKCSASSLLPSISKWQFVAHLMLFFALFSSPSSVWSLLLLANLTAISFASTNQFEIFAITDCFVLEFKLLTSLNWPLYLKFMHTHQIFSLFAKHQKAVSYTFISISEFGLKSATYIEFFIMILLFSFEVAYAWVEADW